jgi:hypothetical protein
MAFKTATYLSFGFSIPFLAAWYQLYVLYDCPVYVLLTFEFLFILLVFVVRSLPNSFGLLA